MEHVTLLKATQLVTIRCIGLVLLGYTTDSRLQVRTPNKPEEITEQAKSEVSCRRLLACFVVSVKTLP